MLVDVVSVLKVPVSVMDVVDVVAVRDLLAVVVIGVWRPMIGVNFRLRVALSVVDVVDVVAVDDRLVPVTWKVLVVAGFGVFWHSTPLVHGPVAPL